MGKHLKPEASRILIRAYEKYEHKWRDILADPEIKALNVDSLVLKHHIDYFKRKKRQSHKNRISHSEDGTNSFEKESSKEEDEVDEEEEFELLAITGRKKGAANSETKWFAIYSDGDERWVPHNCFVDLDGTTNELFAKFQADHPGNDDVKPSNSLKRPYNPPPPKSPTIPQKKLKVIKEPLTPSLELPQEKKEIRIKMPSPTNNSLIELGPKTVLDKKSRKLQCLKMIQELMEEDDDELAHLKKEMQEMDKRFSLALKELTESQQQLLTLVKEFHTNK